MTGLQRTLPHLVAVLNGALDDEDVSYDDLFAALLFLNEVGAAGEMVLLSDVLGISSFVERRAGPGGNVEGPYWRSGAPRHDTPADLVPPGTAGEPLTISGRVTDAVTGEPLPAAEVDIWQTDASGRYDHEDPALPAWHMRGVVVADAEGRYRARVVMPRAYQVPTAGPVGRLLEALDRHPWRPAHTHFKVSAAGHRPLTTMAYYDGDPWLHDDVIDSVKPESVRTPERTEDGLHIAFDLALHPNGT